jgi:hypothetical protein
MRFKQKSIRSQAIHMAQYKIWLTLNIFYCSKRQKDKTQVKQLRQSSPITYISKYTIEHNDI